MRFTESRRPRGQDEPVLPLINIVFLLLIFFMVAGKLTSSDPFEVTPPDSAAEALPDAEAPTLLLATDGSLAFEGEVLDEAGLRAVLARLRDEGGLERLRLRADAAADTPDVVALMALLRESGVERLHLLTLQALPEPAQAGAQEGAGP